MLQIHQCGLQPGVPRTYGKDNLVTGEGISARHNYDIRGRVYFLVIFHTIGVQYLTVGSRRLKKDGSLSKDVWINLIHSREINGTDSLAGGIDTCPFTKM